MSCLFLIFIYLLGFIRSLRFPKDSSSSSAQLCEGVRCFSILFPVARDFSASNHSTFSHIRSFFPFSKYLHISYWSSSQFLHLFGLPFCLYSATIRHILFATWDSSLPIHKSEHVRVTAPIYDERFTNNACLECTHRNILFFVQNDLMYLFNPHVFQF